MPKSTAERVREAEASHRQRGERQIKLWVRADYPEDAETLRNLAKELLAKRPLKFP
jgi:L-alanine-DL-glutamate epimerase-like enolase superfamily enzyme